MTLMTPMESFIRLGKDKTKRRKTLLALRDEKIETARSYIERQAQCIDTDRQFFYLDSFEKFGKFYTVDFSIAKLENTTLEEVAAVIQNHFFTTNDGISQLLGNVTNREVQYRTCHEGFDLIRPSS